MRHILLNVGIKEKEFEQFISRLQEARRTTGNVVFPIVYLEGTEDVLASIPDKWYGIRPGYTVAGPTWTEGMDADAGASALSGKPSGARTPDQALGAVEK